MTQETLRDRAPAAVKRLGDYIGRADHSKNLEFFADLMAIHAVASEALRPSVPENAVLIKQLPDEAIKTVGALVAWGLAIRSCIGKPYPSANSLEDMATQYGRQITDKIHLDGVSEWFNWDMIDHYLTNQNIDR